MIEDGKGRQQPGSSKMVALGPNEGYLGTPLVIKLAVNCWQIVIFVDS